MRQQVVIPVPSNSTILTGSYDDMMINYRELLSYIKSAVTRNHSEKSINSILDYVSVSKNVIVFLVNFCLIIKV